MREVTAKTRKVMKTKFEENISQNEGSDWFEDWG